MKNKSIYFLIFLSALLFISSASAKETDDGNDEVYEEDDFTRFPAGTLSPMLGASMLGYGDTVLGGITAGAGYYIIDRLELFGTASIYFGDATMISIDPGVQWIFWETRYFAPYLKARGGPIFVLSDGGGTSGTIFGGGGFYVFAGNAFGIKLGGLVGYLLDSDFNKTFAWMLDIGLMF